jgi:hypothetical protein
MKIDNLVIEKKKVSELMPAGYNPRTISSEALDGLKRSIKKFGLVAPVIWNKRTGVVVGGHQRLKVLLAEGVEETDVVVVDFSEKEEIALNITLNNPEIRGHWTDDVVTLLADMSPDMSEDISAESLKSWLSENSDVKFHDPIDDPFTVEPISLLDAKGGPWQARKKLWKELGIQSEVGRDKALAFTHRAPEKATDFVSKKILRGEAKGTSIFDPVLCEMIYKWYCPEGGLILDPFCGGSVRGIVASRLGRKYVGFDIREEQVVANRSQAEEILSGEKPTWITADSRNIKTAYKGGPVDFFFSCPPYFDLEVYSDKEEDLSTMKWDAFCEAYKGIIADGLSFLKPGCFGCFVIGDVRDKEGFYRGFVPLTIEAFDRVGVRLYNEMLFLTPVGHLALRCGAQFSGSRKLGKSHQNVLVFRKEIVS